MVSHSGFGVATSSSVRLYVCEYDGCDKTFSRKSNQKAHMRMHTGEMPYACPHCTKKFKWKSCLASHERVHTRRFRTDIPDNTAFSHQSTTSSSSSHPCPYQQHIRFPTQPVGYPTPSIRPQPDSCHQDTQLPSLSSPQHCASNGTLLLLMLNTLCRRPFHVTCFTAQLSVNLLF